MVGPVFSSLSFLLWGSYLRSPPSRSQSRLLYRIMQIVMTDRRAGPPPPLPLWSPSIAALWNSIGPQGSLLASFTEFHPLLPNLFCVLLLVVGLHAGVESAAGWRFTCLVWIFFFKSMPPNTVTRSIQCQLVIVDFFSYFYGLEPLNGPPLHYRHVGYWSIHSLETHRSYLFFPFE